MSGFSSADNIQFTRENLEPNIVIKETPESELYDEYQLKKCISWITQNNYQKTCLQFPNELLNDGVSIALYLEKELGRTFYILADTAFGSCCVDNISAEHVNADSVIHFGHACLSPFTKLPVLYIFECSKIDLNKLKNAVETTIKVENQLVIFYDDVYHHLYNELCDTFQNSDNVFVTKLALPEDIATKEENEKQLFGRIFKYPVDKDSVAIFLGEDCVTLLNLVLALPGIEWYYYTENEGLVNYNMNRNKFFMKKYHQVEVVKDANILGILIGTLAVECFLDVIERIKLLAKKRGKKCYILAVGRPNVCKLANFPEIDVFVWIACAENVSKDFREYYKPVVSLFEVEMALGNHELTDEYLNDFKEILLKYPVVDEEGLSTESDVSLTSGKIRAHSKFEGSLAVQEKAYGALIEAKGSDFLASRSWKGLDKDSEKKEVMKAEIGRMGIPQGYENEFDTMEKEDNQK